MNGEEPKEFAVYKVLVNHEEQYSLWPAHLNIPRGWEERKQGSKDECLAYVKEVWTDMRPLSLRKRMAEAAAGASARHPL
jgi:MbtH protein